MLTAHCMNLVWPLSLLFVAYYDNVNAVKATSTWEACSSHTQRRSGRTLTVCVVIDSAVSQ